MYNCIIFYTLVNKQNSENFFCVFLHTYMPLEKYLIIWKKNIIEKDIKNFKLFYKREGITFTKIVKCQ